MAPNVKEKDKTDKRGPFSFSRKHRFLEREFQDGTELRFILGKVESWGRGRTKIFMGKRGTSLFCVSSQRDFPADSTEEREGEGQTGLESGSGPRTTKWEMKRNGNGDGHRPRNKGKEKRKES